MNILPVSSTVLQSSVPFNREKVQICENMSGVDLQLKLKGA